MAPDGHGGECCHTCHNLARQQLPIAKLRSFIFGKQQASNSMKLR